GRKRGMALFMVNQQSLWTMKYRSKSGAATRERPRSPQRGRLQHQGDFVAVGESESGASRGKVFSPKRVAGSRGHAAKMRRKREVIVKTTRFEACTKLGSRCAILVSRANPLILNELSRR